jgi:hypothetical protein
VLRACCTRSVHSTVSSSFHDKVPALSPQSEAFRAFRKLHACCKTRYVNKLILYWKCGAGWQASWYCMHHSSVIARMRQSLQMATSGQCLLQTTGSLCHEYVSKPAEVRVDIRFHNNCMCFMCWRLTNPCQDMRHSTIFTLGLVAMAPSGHSDRSQTLHGLMGLM